MKPLKHIQKYIFNGIFTLLPVALVYIVIRFIFITIDQNVLNIIDNYIGFRLPGLGTVVTLIFIYIIGLLSSNLIGKWFLSLIDKITDKIPLIGITYRVGKQISSTLSLPEKQVFKKVVLINYMNEYSYTIGFITGKITDNNSKSIYYKIFVPTPPNPTTGTMLIVPEGQVTDPGWTVEEGFRSVISAGIIGPENIALKKSNK